MKLPISELNRRKFLRGVGGFALALPAFESFMSIAGAAEQTAKRRLACFYLPDGVPMPHKDDPGHKDWNWFPHGRGKDFTFTKTLSPLEALREETTVLGGLSHPAVRNVHGHSNADQFLTGADTGGSGKYVNTISLDQKFALQVGDETRFSSLVMSTDGGTGSPRGAQTMSFNQNGKVIPAENRPKRIFDMLFVKSDAEAERRLAMSQSVLDDLMADAKSLERQLSKTDRKTLDEYLQSVRETEIKVEKAKRWMNIPLPTVDVDHLKLDITPEDPRTYVQTMYELIYLAFKTDSTRVATYQLGRENGVGISDYLARAVGFNLTHQLSHNTKQPDGWKNFGLYCQFIAKELVRFAQKLKETPEVGGQGNMLDNSVLFFGSASSSFHLSRNYPLLLIGGRNMGFKHGQFLRYGEESPDKLPQDDRAYRSEMNYEEVELSKLYVTMLQRLGVETDSFGGSTGTLAEV